MRFLSSYRSKIQILFLYLGSLYFICSATNELSQGPPFLSSWSVCKQKISKTQHRGLDRSNLNFKNTNFIYSNLNKIVVRNYTETFTKLLLNIWYLSEFIWSSVYYESPCSGRFVPAFCASPALTFLAQTSILVENF